MLPSPALHSPLHAFRTCSSRLLRRRACLRFVERFANSSERLQQVEMIGLGGQTRTNRLARRRRSAARHATWFLASANAPSDIAADGQPLARNTSTKRHAVNSRTASTASQSVQTTSGVSFDLASKVCPICSPYRYGLSVGP